MMLDNSIKESGIRIEPMAKMQIQKAIFKKPQNQSEDEKKRPEIALLKWIGNPAQKNWQPWASCGMNIGEAGFTLLFYCQDALKIQDPSFGDLQEAVLILKETGLLKKRITHDGNKILLWTSENIENRLMGYEFVSWLKQPANQEQQPWAKQDDNKGTAGVTAHQVGIEFLKIKDPSRSILKTIAYRLQSLGFFRRLTKFDGKPYSLWRTKAGEFNIDSIKLMEWLQESSHASWAQKGQTNREAGITSDLVGRHFLGIFYLTAGERRRVSYQLRRYGFVCQKRWVDKKKELIWFYRKIICEKG